ncbi:MAG: FumA C-terminus/TtdB family hydratase beta subunit [Candidatus Thermoplasmatota archaeon]
MEHRLHLPLDESTVKRLHVGDIIYVNGLLCTLRDRGYKKLLSISKDEVSFSLDGKGVYHCGPLMKKNASGGWFPISAGPTTSNRMSSMIKGLLERYEVRLIIGKGLLDDSVNQILKENVSTYSVFTGGAGALAATMIEGVDCVYWLDELGMTEAVWVLRVKDFGPLVVSMDAHGESLYKKKKLIT